MAVSGRLYAAFRVADGALRERHAGPGAPTWRTN
jgi:hypothetical protein